MSLPHNQPETSSVEVPPPGVPGRVQFGACTVTKLPGMHMILISKPTFLDIALRARAGIVQPVSGQRLC